MMRLSDSIPLLKKISDLPSEYISSMTVPTEKPSQAKDNKSALSMETKNAENELEVTSPSSAGLPKSPRPTLSPEGLGSPLRKPKVSKNGSYSDSTRGRTMINTDSKVSVRRRSMTPSSRSNTISHPTDTAQRNPTPTSTLPRADSRDDSHYEGSVGPNTVHSLNFSSPPSQNGDDIDDIMIHRYLAQKSNLRASEAKNTALHAHIEDLNRYFDEEMAKTEIDRMTYETKIEQNQQIIESLEQTARDLQDQLSKQALETGEQVKTIRFDAEKQIKSIRQDGDNSLNSLKKELSTLQSKYTASQKALGQEKENVKVSKARIADIEQLCAERGAELEKKIQEVVEMDSKLEQSQKKTMAIEKSSQEEVSQLHNALDNLNEMVAFQNEKNKDLSSELKLMSLQYVQSIEKLDVENAKSRDLSKQLDAVEARLKEEMRRNVDISNQLEEMARGYIDTDELLEKERGHIDMLTSTMDSLRNELSQERGKSQELASSLENTNASVQEKSDEVLKLTGLSTSLTDELDSVKKTLAKALSKVKSLTEKKKESSQLIAEQKDRLKKEKESVLSLTAELDETKKKSLSFSNDLTAIKLGWEEDKTKLSEMSKKFEEMAIEYDTISCTFEKAQTNYSDEIVGKEKEIALLLSEVKTLKEEETEQKNTIAALENSLRGSNEEIEELDAALKVAREECDKFRTDLSMEKEDSQEKIAELEETIGTLTKELETLEKQHSNLFDNLVDTESSFHSTKDALDECKTQLKTKDEEFKSMTDMLKEEVSSKESSLKKEQEKSLSLSAQVVEINKKCNTMYSNLVKTEERALQMEESSQNLQNQLSIQEQKCKELALSLEREKNGPIQRKLKVAKKMIKAEKERHKAILKEVGAKNIIIGRIEKQSEQYLKELQSTKEALEVEKEKKTTHSGRELQELHKQLVEERKALKNEKEDMRSMLRIEKGKIKSLTMRLSALEGSAEGGAAASRALKEQFENHEEIRQLAEKNAKLQLTVEEKAGTEDRLKDRVKELETKIQEFTISMETMTQYCNGLEKEKMMLKEQLESKYGPQASFFDHTGRDDDTSTGDEDTLDGRSLSDFSIALVPAPRQTQSDLLKKRTTVKEKVWHEEDEGEDVELTVDTRLIYDD